MIEGSTALGRRTVAPETPKLVSLWGVPSEQGEEIYC